MHAGGRGEADLVTDLPNRRRIPALVHRVADEFEDAALPGGQLLAHHRVPPEHSFRTRRPATASSCLVDFNSPRMRRQTPVRILWMVVDIEHLFGRP